MGELLLPGVPCRVEECPSAVRAVPRTLVAVERMGRPVVLHTHLTNAAARFLLERGLVPGLEGTTIVRAEAPRGHSRFDFLLDRGGRKVWLEVKSCTLFGRSIAMFPDAVTERGRRHVEELASLPEGEEGAVLLVVQSPDAVAFLPDYHTDPAFARTFLSARGKVSFHPVAVRWDEELSLLPWARPLPVPWPLLERELCDGGAYLLLLELPRRARIAVGALGEVDFPEGWYVYAGSARGGLSARIDRHRRLRKNLHWHVDHLRGACRFAAAFPVMTADDLECALAAAVRELAGAEVPCFGSSDCGCRSHLFRFGEDPRRLPAFQALIQRFRIDRLEGLLPR
jgi:sugar fermentation stimulation protein A